VDGDHWTVYKQSELQGLIDSLREFIEHGDVGDSVELTIAEMSEDEIDALPDI
jgi:hypothetical protein